MSVEQIQDRLLKVQVVLKEFPQFKYLGDPILRTPTEPVEDNEGIKIGRELGEVLIKYRNLTGMGRGLAAPQIGINKSVFVTYLDNKVQTYINPKIIQFSEQTNFYKELCLSSLMMWAKIKRPSTMEMEWTDEAVLKQKREFDGVLARLLQHEEDHLRGVCNLDRATGGTIEIQLDDPLQEKLTDK